MDGVNAGTTLSEHDRSALIDLIVEFAWRIDHGSADTVHELVTDDVLIHMAYGPLVGKDAVIAWGGPRAAVDRTTRHIMTNFRFRVVDQDRVEGTSQLLIFVHAGPGIGEAAPWGLAECSDVFVREDGRWKFQSHVTTDVFFTGPHLH